MSTPSPDQELLELAQQLEITERTYIQHKDRTDLTEEQSLAAYHGLCVEIESICDKMFAIPARTLAGLSAKARAGRIAWERDHVVGEHNVDDSFEHIAVSIFDEATALAGGPAAPAETDFARLYALWLLADAREDEAARIADECRDRTEKPSIPEALFAQPADAHLGGASLTDKLTGRKYYDADAVDDLHRRFIDGPESTSPHKQRAVEIIAARSDYEARRDAAEQTSGWRAAERESEAIGRENQSFRQLLIRMPCENERDLLLKIELAARCYRWDQDRIDDLLEGRPELAASSAEAAMFAVLRDFVRMKNRERAVETVRQGARADG